MRRMLLLIACMTALAACTETSGGTIDLIDVSGPLDASALDFISDSIEAGAEEGRELAVVQINSPAVLDREAFDRLASLIELPPMPVAVWVGPGPAVAYGGAGRLPGLASQAAMAPGTELGRFEPEILGEGGARTDEIVPASASGFDLQPSVRQYLQDLDGNTFQTAAGPVVVTTLEEIDDGVTTKSVTFRKPSLATRFFRLAVTPEAMFLFLVLGLSIAVFEFYALGPGVAAGVAGVSLLLAGWGLLTLPINWWALALVAGGFLLLVAAHQRGGLLAMTFTGAVCLQFAGMFLVDGGGQIDARWWLILASVLAVLFFFLLAMPTVQRARLSTETIGRESLVGETGIALADFDPDGLVEVRGARWRGTAHREAGISAGSPVVVTGVDGLFLEVEPDDANRET